MSLMVRDGDLDRLYRVRRTVLEMLRDRGYSVDEDAVNLTKEQFMNKFGDIVTRSELQMTMNKLDSSEKISVFFPERAEVDVAMLKDYVRIMEQDKSLRAILVLQQEQDLTAFARRCLTKIAPRYHMEVFKEIELLTNITHHSLVPKHQVLSDAETKDLLSRYKETELPSILMTDPVARYYGLVEGQAVRIIRESEFAGRAIYYRYCDGRGGNEPEPEPELEPVGWQCPLCDKSFKSERAMCGHQRVHKNKPFEGSSSEPEQPVQEQQAGDLILISEDEDEE